MWRTKARLDVLVVKVERMVNSNTIREKREMKE